MAANVLSTVSPLDDGGPFTDAESLERLEALRQRFGMAEVAGPSLLKPKLRRLPMMMLNLNKLRKVAQYADGTPEAAETPPVSGAWRTIVSRRRPVIL